VLAGLGKTTESEAELGRAVELGADPETTLQLARIAAGHGNWDRAAALLNKAQTALGVTAEVPYQHALACLKAGDMPGYRRVCTEAVQAVLQDKLSLQEAMSVAGSCAMGPQALADFGPILQFMEDTLKKVRPEFRPMVLDILGALLHRAGRDREAVRRIEESIGPRAGSAGFDDALFLAFAHERLGEHTEARKWLRHALAAPASGDFWEKAEIQLLRREADAVFGRKAAPGR